MYSIEMTLWYYLFYLQKFTLVSTENEMAIKFLYLYEFRSSYFNINSKYSRAQSKRKEKITILIRILYVLT